MKPPPCIKGSHLFFDTRPRKQLTAVSSQFKGFTMKLHLAILLSLVCLAVASPIRSKRDEEAGSTEELKGALETVDIDSLLKNQRYIETQIKCVRHSGKCDKTGKQIKVLLPEVLQRSCASCGEKQKYNINRVVEHVKANYPSDWTAIDEEYSKA